MANVNLNDNITTLDKFLGINLSTTGETSLKIGEASKMINFRVTENYKISKRYGYRNLCNFDSPIRGVWYGNFNGVMIFYLIVSNKIYSYVPSTNVYTQIGLFGTNITDTAVNIFYFNKVIYFLDAINYIYYYYNGKSCNAVNAYIPLLVDRAVPTGEGIICETANMLTDKVRKRFCPNGEKSYSLTGSVKTVDVVKVANVIVSSYNYAVSYDKSSKITSIVFHNAPPYSSNPDVDVEYSLSTEINNRIAICSNKYTILFSSENGTKLFLYGGSVGNTLYYSEKADYIPVENYIRVGDGQYNITSTVRQYDRLIVFTEGDTWYTYYNPLNDGVQPAFPIYPLNASLGNIGCNSAKSIQNEPISLAKDGVYRWISTNIQDKLNAVYLSQRVKSALSIDFLKNAKTFNNHKFGEFWIAYDGVVWIYNYILNVWYCFDNIYVDNFIEIDNEVGFYHNNILYIFDETLYMDNNNKYCAIWESGYMDFDLSNKNKNLHRLYISLSPEKNGSVTVTLIPNNSSPLTIGENNELSCTLIPVTFKKRAKIRQFSYIKISIQNDKIDGCATIMNFKFQYSTS